MNLATNPSLPLSWRRRGTYIFLNTNNPGPAQGPRVLLLGYVNDSGALRPANALYRVADEQAVIDGAGRGSVLHNMYLAAVAQIGAGDAEIWIGQVADSGTAATHTFKIAGTATGAGQLDWYLNGTRISVDFESGDTAATIAAALKAQADLATNLPCTFGVSSTKITCTARHQGAFSDDLPMMFYVTPGQGISITTELAYATNASGAGSATLTIGRDSYSFTLAGGETPTQIADGVAALISGEGPVTASASTGTLTLTYQNGQVIGRIIGKIVTSTGTTIAVNGGSAIAAGTNSPNGVAGAGTPTLTTLLSTIGAQRSAFKAWAACWNDTSTLGTIAAHVRDNADGRKQKGQTLTTCSRDALATAGAIPAATSPTLTGANVGERCALLWPAFEAPNCAWMYSARVAAARAANDVSTGGRKNWDGLELRSSTASPLLAPALYSRADDETINSAIDSYFMAPLVFDEDSGTIVVDFGRTTSNSADRALHNWSLIDQLDAQRAKAVQRLSSLFGGKSAMRNTDVVPFTSDIFTLEDVEDAMYQLTVEWERSGFFDGADAVKDGIRATFNGSDPTRIDLVYTATVVTPVHQISGVANRAAASL